MEKPLESFEKDFIQNVQRVSGLRIHDHLSSEFEELSGIVGSEGSQVVVLPAIIDNYSKTQRIAEGLNSQTDKPRYVGCTCGRIHERDSKSGFIDTGWY